MTHVTVFVWGKYVFSKFNVESKYIKANKKSLIVLRSKNTNHMTGKI